MTPIERFASQVEDSTLPEALAELGEYLIAEGRYHELFEAAG